MTTYTLAATGRLAAIAESLRALAPLAMRDLLLFDVASFDALAPLILQAAPRLTPGQLVEVVIEVPQ